MAFLANLGHILTLLSISAILYLVGYGKQLQSNPAVEQ